MVSDGLAVAVDWTIPKELGSHQPRQSFRGLARHLRETTICSLLGYVKTHRPRPVSLSELAAKDTAAA